MSIQITTWRPDTCGCQIKYAWDDSFILEDRVHTVVEVQTCQEHSGSLDQVFDKVLAENQNKNKILGAIIENHPDLVDTDSNGSKALKPEYDYVWSFNDQRKLQVELKGADKATAEAIDATIKSEIGSDAADVKIP